jgi:hypothetical protein
MDTYKEQEDMKLHDNEMRNLYSPASNQFKKDERDSACNMIKIMKVIQGVSFRRHGKNVTYVISYADECIISTWIIKN